jgi:hypothetical protein
MYKQQTHAPDRHHHHRDEQEEAHADAISASLTKQTRIQPSRRASDPITLFSQNESEALRAQSRQPILPRLGPSGLFAGQLPHATESLLTDDDAQTTSTRTSLGSALEEVLDSVDQATEDLARVRCQQRITEWLGQQPAMAAAASATAATGTTHDNKRRRIDAEDWSHIRRLSARVLRDLLNLDADCYSLLVKATTWRGRQRLSVKQQAHARAMEQQLMGTWMALAQRDTATLSSQLKREPLAGSVAGEPLSTRVPLWGIPEEQGAQQEESSLQVILRYLQNFFGERTESSSLENATSAARVPTTATGSASLASSNLTSLAGTQSQQINRASMTTASTADAPAASSMTQRTPRPILSRHVMQTRDGSMRGSRQSSCSSSFRSVSLNTASNSRHSLRRHMHETASSHFWEITSSFRSGSLCSVK